MKKPTNITVKRWFQKTYGNTYFSAYVTFDDGSEEQLIKFQYGYGSQGEYEAVKRLKCEGYNTAGVEVTVVDVNRKKDM